MAFQSVVPLAGGRVPDFGFSVEGAGHDFVSVGVVKGHRVHDVGVLIEGEQLLAGNGVPDLAGSVVGACDEFVSRLVECAIGQREQMGSQDLVESELLLLVFLLLFDQLLNELLQLWLAGLGDQGLLEQDLIDESVDISSKEGELVCSNSK